MLPNEFNDLFWRAEPRSLSSDASLVELEPPTIDASQPAILRATVDGVDLAWWLTNEQEKTTAWLHEHGALLFRGFEHAPSRAAYEALWPAVIAKPMAYSDRSSPRTQVAEGIYTSTDYPAAYDIVMHSELSYSHAWPERLAFFCVRAAQEGGATPVADTRRVLEALCEETRARFAELGVRYTRRLSPELGLTWQEVYRTDDRGVVEEHCRARGIDSCWKDDDGLTISWSRPAIVTHPHTNEPVWFNHALFFNAASLDPEMARALGRGAAAPFDTCYGDGSSIEGDTLHEIAAAYRQCERSFAWCPGELLLIDNLLVAHGRRSYSGERCILVAMGAT